MITVQIDEFALITILALVIGGVVGIYSIKYELKKTREAQPDKAERQLDREERQADREERQANRDN